MRKTHPQLLALQPAAPETFVLEFEPGSSTLTAESQARLPDVIARAQARAGGEIVVTGHTDRQGALEANDQLSLERAQAVRNLMIERGFKGELIEAVGRGEREPGGPHRRRGGGAAQPPRRGGGALNRATPRSWHPNTA